MHCAGDSQRQRIEQAIREGGGDFSEVARIVQASGSIAYVRRRAGDESDRAAAAARLLPASVYRDSLLELNVFAMERDR
jgi:octaprenyl-diphosphate synthase